jgi:hypothetical protein
MEPEDLELDHEWLQLIQMEKAIEEKNPTTGNWSPESLESGRGSRDILGKRRKLHQTK